MRRIPFTALAAACGALAVPAAAMAASEDGSQRFHTTLDSAVEDAAAHRVSLPLRHGRTTDGRSFTYVVLDSSDRRDADRRGVNRAPKLAHARGTGAVQQGRYVDGVLVVAATVDFAPVRAVQAGPSGFPPAQADPGSVGEPGYSPLVELPGGTVIDAPHVANATGDHDKLLAREGSRGVFLETAGFYDGHEVRYVSFEATDRAVAALEGGTHAPALDAAPGLGSNDPKRSARSQIAPFLNGQTGLGNPQRQGLASALLDGADPLNVVNSAPHNDRYSPLWDVHAAQWTEAAAQAGANTRQERFDDVVDLAEEGTLTGPGGAPFGPIGVIVTCPIVSTA